MSFSKHSYAPDMKADILGWLRWEYDRIRFLTRLPSSAFYYNASASKEAIKGATSAAFAFEAIYGHEYGSNCKLRVDGKKATTDAVRKFISPLRRVHEAILQRGVLPHSVRLAPADSEDEGTARASLLQVMYLVDVLLGWFQRARAVLVARTKGHNLNSIMSVTPFVPVGHLPQASWDWAKGLVRGHRRTYSSSDKVSARMELLISWVDETTRPVVEEDDPENWSFNNNDQRPGAAAAGDSNQQQSGTTHSTSPDDTSYGEGHNADADSQEQAGQAQPGAPDSGDSESRDTSVQLPPEPVDDEAQAKEREAPPIPQHAPSMAQDASAISGVDLMELLFTDIPLITRLPTEYWEQWARANTTVHKWVQSAAVGSQEHDNALFWELLLHRLLLRKSSRSRGQGRRSGDTLAARLHAFATGDYQSLVRGLEKTCAAAKKRQQQFRGNQEARVLSRVERLLAQGRFSKAFRLLESKGQADLGRAGVVDQLNAKHGPRVHSLPGTLPQGLPARVTFNLQAFAKGYRELKPLSGVGPDGYRYEYLSCLATNMACPLAAEAISRHKDFAEMFVNAELPSWYYWVACATKMIALVKKHADVEGGVPDVRPIGMGGCKRRAWTTRLMQDNATVFNRTFWPVQVAVGVKAGVPKLIAAVMEHMRHHKGHVLMKLDFTNAFNSVWRKAVLKACYDNPEWRHLYRFFWCTLSPKSKIFGIDNLSEEGVQQGCPAGPTGYCMSTNPDFAWAARQLKADGGMAVTDMDDGYFLGPVETVMRVVKIFQSRVQGHVGADLNPSKCELWCHRQHRQRLRDFMAHENVGEFQMGTATLSTGRKTYGVMVSGVPVGDAEYVSHKMKIKTNKVVSQIKNITNRLQPNSCQNLFALLVQCLHQKLQFWMQTMAPEVLEKHLKRFDRVMLAAVRRATGQPFPTNGSLPYKRLRLPRKFGGGMIRSAWDVSRAAYVGGICQCVPSFTRSVDKEGEVSEGILDHMADLYGTGSFDVGSESTRFTTLLQGESILGKELLAHFTHMRREVHGNTPCDEMEDDSPFKMGPEGAGVVRGEALLRPQKEFTKARECERAREIFAALKLKLNRRGVMPARDEAAFLSINRMSVQFVGLPKMQRTVMDNTTFREAWSVYMGTESPVCARWVGTRFVDNLKRTYTVDAFGDNVGRAMMNGGGWTTRHDAFKWTLAQQAAWAMYQVRVEPNNLFLPWIKQRQQFLATVKARKRQGMVPDFLDIKRQALMDVKGCAFGTRYSPARFFQAQTCDAVRSRQQQVHTDALRKAKQVDAKYNGWDKHSDIPGPMAQRLADFGRVEGLVVGAHGEASKDLISLIRRITDRACQTRFRQMGFQSPRSAKSTVKQQIYLSLGIEAVRGMARLRIQNLAAVLAGSKSTKAAAARRARAKRQYDEQAHAYWARHCYFDI